MHFLLIVKILAKRLTGRLAFAKSGSSDKIQISTAAMCGELERDGCRAKHFYNRFPSPVANSKQVWKLAEIQKREKL